MTDIEFYEQAAVASLENTQHVLSALLAAGEQSGVRYVDGLRRAVASVECDDHGAGDTAMYAMRNTMRMVESRTDVFDDAEITEVRADLQAVTDYRNLLFRLENRLDEPRDDEEDFG